MVQESVQREWTQPLGGPEEGPPEALSGSEAADTPEEPSQAILAFPEAWKDDFEGLAFLGYLEDTVRIPFHQFVLRTLLPADKLEIGLICREHDGSLGFNKAYMAAVVAASLHLVDGQPLLVAEKKSSAIRQRFLYVTNTWYEPVIDLLYQRVNELEARQRRVMIELGILPE